MENLNRTVCRSSRRANLSYANNGSQNTTKPFTDSTLSRNNTNGLECSRKNSSLRKSLSCDGISVLATSIVRSRADLSLYKGLVVAATKGERRSISLGNVNKRQGKAPLMDRFIPCRSAMNIDKCDFLMNNGENNIMSPNENGIIDEHTIAKRKLLGVNESVLHFHKPPIQPLIDDMVRRWTDWSGCAEDAQLLQRARGKHYRNVNKVPERILDAPDIRDDFYVQLLDWSFSNVVALALDNQLYLWNAETHESSCLRMHEETPAYYSSLAFHPKQRTIAFALSNGTLELMDYDIHSTIRAFSVSEDRVATIDWHRNIVTCGSRDGTISLHDMGCPESLVASISLAHLEEVCGIRWSPCERYIASGGNDNRVHVWDIRYINNQKRPCKPAMSLPHSAHKAAVKALAWCPWQPAVLATGGGASCRSIRLTNVSNHKVVSHVKDTGSQITGLIWSERHRELMSSHGQDKYQLTLWRTYPGRLVRLGSHWLLDHMGRVICISLSPDGQTVASVSSDERLRFWGCFAKQDNTRVGGENIWDDLFDQPAGALYNGGSLFRQIR